MPPWISPELPPSALAARPRWPPATSPASAPTRPQDAPSCPVPPRRLPPPPPRCPGSGAEPGGPCSPFASPPGPITRATSGCASPQGGTDKRPPRSRREPWDGRPRGSDQQRRGFGPSEPRGPTMPLTERDPAPPVTRLSSRPVPERGHGAPGQGGGGGAVSPTCPGEGALKRAFAFSRAPKSLTPRGCRVDIRNCLFWLRIHARISPRPGVYRGRISRPRWPRAAVVGALTSEGESPPGVTTGHPRPSAPPPLPGPPVSPTPGSQQLRCDGPFLARSAKTSLLSIRC